MSVQQSLIIMVGHKFVKDPTIDEIPEENDFHNFESYREQNMDGNLKFVVDGMNGEYAILGLPLSVTYLDEGDTLDVFTVLPLWLETQIKEVEKQLSNNPLMGNEKPNVKLHVLMHVT